MVAISLYKGNFHKAPDVPRRWPAPTPKISLKDFKILLRRRERALARLRSSAGDAQISVATTSSPTRSPAAEPNHANTDSTHVDNDLKNSDGDNHVDNYCSEPELLPKGDLKEREREKEKVMRDEREDSLKKLMEKTDAMMEEHKNEGNVKEGDKSEAVVTPEGEKSNLENATSDAQKRTKEVKEKLEILNEKKHSLVQVLKQILTAEEQLKRQNSTQGVSGHPPLQVDTTNTDSGSMTKVNTPRISPDGIPCSDVGGEPDDVSNHNMTSHHLPRTSSTSPSSDSQQRKPISIMVPLSSRATIGIAGCPPSRFAPAGQSQGQVHSALSASATSYAVSSPSPAASGGTSVFRDASHPTSWN